MLLCAWTPCVARALDFDGGEWGPGACLEEEVSGCLELSTRRAREGHLLPEMFCEGEELSVLRTLGYL